MTAGKALLVLGAAAGLITTAPAMAALSAPVATQAKADILAVVANMEAAWNRGDMPGYMAGFENPGVRFVSNGRMSGGWQAQLDSYIKNYARSADGRGHLHFYDITIDVYSPDAALLISHFHLERSTHPLEGINTRIFRKIGGHWVIDMNHVSSFEAHQGDPGTESHPAEPPR